MDERTRRFFNDDTVWVPWRYIAAVGGLERGERGCCCSFAEDGETLLTVCAAHRYWADNLIAAAKNDAAS